MNRQAVSADVTYREPVRVVLPDVGRAVPTFGRGVRRLTRDGSPALFVGSLRFARRAARLPHGARADRTEPGVDARTQIWKAARPVAPSRCAPAPVPVPFHMEATHRDRTSQFRGSVPGPRRRARAANVRTELSCRSSCATSTPDEGTAILGATTPQRRERVPCPPSSAVIRSRRRRSVSWFRNSTPR